MKMRFKDVVPWLIGLGGIALVALPKSKTATNGGKAGDGTDIKPAPAPKPGPGGSNIDPDLIAVAMNIQVGDTVEVRRDLVTIMKDVSQYEPIFQWPEFHALPGPTIVQIRVGMLIPEMWRGNTFGRGLEGVVTGYLAGGVVTPMTTPTPHAQAMWRDVTRVIVPARDPILTRPPFFHV